VIEAYKAGIALAQAAGKDLSKIHSVASFFVSRVDTEIDKRLVALGTDEAVAMKSKAALANARLAYEVFETEFAKADWSSLSAAGANKQRPLMASTGVKDPALSGTLYVTELIAPELVNTMPEKTMEAVFDHGIVPENSISGTYVDAKAVLDAIEKLGISYDEVTELLETEGVDKFIISWNELVESVDAALKDSK
jgi:transaldolase